MNETDVLIIGAGIAGASVAWRLARAGLQVRMVERESQPAFHSTGRSAAMFMESYGPPGVRALTRASRALYVNPPPGFADAPLVSPRSAVFVATADQLEALQALQDELAAGGTVLPVLDEDALLRAAPPLRRGRFARALLDDSGFDLDVHALLQGFLRGAKAAGASLSLGVEPVSASRSDAGWDVRLSDSSTVRARTVVNAAGAWVDVVTARFGVAPIGIEPRRRSVFTFPAPAGADTSRWAMVADVDEAWYFKPDAGQMLGSPANADPTTPHDVQPEELDIAMGIHEVQEATGWEIRRPSSTWAGLRSFVTDGEIVIGFDDASPGFFWLAAQGGYGIQSAAGASELAALLIQGLPLSPDLIKFGVDPAALRPSRLR